MRRHDDDDDDDYGCGERLGLPEAGASTVCTGETERGCWPLIGRE